MSTVSDHDDNKVVEHGSAHLNCACMSHYLYIIIFCACLCLTSSVSTVSSLLLTGCPAPGRRAPIGMFKLA